MNTRWVAVLVLLLGVMAMSVRVRAQRLGPERDLTVPESRASSLSQFRGLPARTSDGFLVAFLDRTTTDGSRLARFRADGSLILSVPGDTIPIQPMSLTCNGGVCVAATATNLLRFREDGTLIDAAPLPSPAGDIVVTTSGVLVVSTVGDAHSVVRLLPTGSDTFGPEQRVHAQCNPGSAGIDCSSAGCMAACVTSTLVVKARPLALDGTPTGAEVTVDPVAEAAGLDVQFSGVDFVVTTPSSVARVAADGTLRRTDARLLWSVSIACNGLGDCFDQTERSTPTGVTPAFIPGVSSVFVESRLVCRPELCFLLRETVGGDTELHASRVDPVTLSMVDLPRFGAVVDDQEGPLVVAGDADSEIALFQRRMDAPQLLSARVGDAPVAAHVVHPLARLNQRIALTPGAGGYGLVSPAPGFTSGVVFRRLNRDGMQQGMEVPLHADARDMAIAWNGTHFLVAFIDEALRVMVQRIDAIGQRIEPSPVEVLPMALEIELASSGGEFLLVTPGRGLRIDATAHPIGSPFLIRDGEFTSFRVAAVAGGYDVAWTETSASGTEIRAARIDMSGTVLDLGGRVIRRIAAFVPEFAMNERYVLWAEHPVGERVVYIVPVDGSSAPQEVARMRETPWRASPDIGLALTERSVIYAATGYAPIRMRVRSLSNTSLGATCTAPSDCDSNFCIDGICCNAACDGACDTCSTAGMCTPMMCDAGMPDANMSSSADAGTTSNIDAAVTPPPPSGGCTASSRPSTHLAWLAALGVLLAARRRRRAH